MFKEKYLMWTLERMYLMLNARAMESLNILCPCNYSTLVQRLTEFDFKMQLVFPCKSPVASCGSSWRHLGRSYPQPWLITLNCKLKKSTTAEVKEILMWGVSLCTEAVQNCSCLRWESLSLMDGQILGVVCCKLFKQLDLQLCLYP